MSETLEKTPFYDIQIAAGARMVEFAGHSMPVQFQGIKNEHLHTRSAASLFDVSHMGQLSVSGASAQAELEALLPVDLDELAQDQMCLTFLTNEEGGILDDLIITRRSKETFSLVVNGACKAHDIEHISAHLVESRLEHFEHHALLALQGPKAADVLCQFIPESRDAIEALTFMHGVALKIQRKDLDCEIYLSRSGYTGEDGFEISIPGDHAEAFAKSLLSNDLLQWAGLGARDSLRLEAGLCLYGHDLDAATTPVEAGLLWAIDKARRAGGSKAGGFPGAEKIFQQIELGPPRKRQGFVVNGRIPVREGATIVNAQDQQIGRVTSGGVAPSFAGLLAMGYVDAGALVSSTAQFYAMVRGKKVELHRHKMPFVPTQYKR